MLIVIFLTAAVAVFSGFVYLKRERLGLPGVGLAALRTVAVCALLILLINPVSSGRWTGGNPVVLLDASLSMAAPGGKWEAALDTALALAGPRGTILRFGTSMSSFDWEPPQAGASRLAGPLRSAVALGGPVHVVTDGELDDAGMVDPGLLENVAVVILVRDTVPDVALLDVDMPEHALMEDSIRITLTAGMWGGRSSSTARLEVTTGDRRLAVHDYELPLVPGIARRVLTLPPRLLPQGTNLLRFKLDASDDLISENDERIRIVTVSEQPAVVVLLNPPDWEGRFLFAELGEISSTAVRGYAHVNQNNWLDMKSALPVQAEAIRRIVLDAPLLVVRGDPVGITAVRRQQSSWDWPTFVDATSNGNHPDWFLSGAVRASPLAGRLTSVQWDSVPPIFGLASQPKDGHDWVALSARQGRRGAQRPALLGKDSAGARSLLTLGTGWWRWRLRGGAAREAYRAMLAAGVDWLLRSDLLRNDVALISSNVVNRNLPVSFQWVGAAMPDSLSVFLTRDGDEDPKTYVLRFDSYGIALLPLPPGAYWWAAPEAAGAGGVVVVEEYSEEYRPRAAVDWAGGNPAGFMLFESYARDNWWLFVIVVVALTGEWAWRHLRGLP